MPLEWYLKYNNYYKAKYLNIDKYNEMVNEDDEFKRYFIEMNDKQLVIQTILEKQNKQIQQIIQNKQLVQEEKDPDSKWLKYTNQVFYINYQQRHELEQKEPFLYGKYSVQKMNGCEHCKCGCQIFCNQCQQYYWCNVCHDLENDHQLKYKDVEKVICINCKKEQPPSKECIYCHQLFTTFWCEKQTTPIFHCKIHDECHINMDEDVRKVCNKCGKCVSGKGYHTCDEIDCVMCLTPIYPQEDRIQLKCNPLHQIHERCWSQFLANGNNTKCPICRKDITPQNIISYEQVTIIKYISGYNNFQFLNGIFKNINLYLNVCSLCKKETLWFEPFICPYCLVQTYEYRSQIQIPNIFFQQLLMNYNLFKKHDDSEQLQQLYKLIYFMIEHKNDLLKNYFDSISENNQIVKRSKQYTLACYSIIFDSYLDVNQNFKNHKQFNKIISKAKQKQLQQLEELFIEEEQEFEE